MSVGEIEINLDELRSKRRGDARFAQRFLYRMGPRDAPLLPLSNHKYKELMWSKVGIKQIAAWYARSLAVFGYEVFDHPDLEVFGSGVMASPFAPRHILDDVDLKIRFLPRILSGLGPGLIWSPPVLSATSPAQSEKLSRWPSPNSRACRRLCERRVAAGTGAHAWNDKVKWPRDILEVPTTRASRHATLTRRAMTPSSGLLVPTLPFSDRRRSP
jgi:hypothetical protein